MDGVTAGVQKRLKQDMGRKHMHPKPYDFMYYTNLTMMVVALVVSLAWGNLLRDRTFVCNILKSCGWWCNLQCVRPLDVPLSFIPWHTLIHSCVRL